MGGAAHMTGTTRHQSWQSTPAPLPDHAGSIPGFMLSAHVLFSETPVDKLENDQDSDLHIVLACDC
jgi:hypothetical protein